MSAKFIIITGNDIVAIKDRTISLVNEIAASIKKENYFDYVIDYENNDKDNLRDIMMEVCSLIRTPILFDGFKLLLFKNFNLPISTKRLINEDILNELVESLKLIKNKEENSFIIFSGTSFDNYKDICLFFKEHGKVIELKNLTNKSGIVDKLKIINNYLKFKKLNIKDSTSFIDFIARNFDFDKRCIYNELDKVISYIGNNDFISFDNYLIISESLKDNVDIFKLLDFISSKDIEASLLTLNQIEKKNKYEKNIDKSSLELSILSNITTRMLVMIFIKENALLQNRNYVQFNEIFNKFIKDNPEHSISNMHPYSIFKVVQQGYHEKFSYNELIKTINYLINAYKSVFEIDNKRLILDNLIIKICKRT